MYVQFQETTINRRRTHAKVTTPGLYGLRRVPHFEENCMLIDFLSERVLSCVILVYLILGTGSLFAPQTRRSDLARTFERTPIF